MKKPGEMHECRNYATTTLRGLMCEACWERVPLSKRDLNQAKRAHANRRKYPSVWREWACTLVDWAIGEITPVVVTDNRVAPGS
jgi:hypothetical protein